MCSVYFFLRKNKLMIVSRKIDRYIIQIKEKRIDKNKILKTNSISKKYF